MDCFASLAMTGGTVSRETVRLSDRQLFHVKQAEGSLTGSKPRFT
ncbi:hypothetical protein ACVMIH_005537 [Bradyrhizobium sp. USDA 4503]